MRPSLALSMIALVAAIGISACSNSSNSATNSADQTSTSSADNSAASSDNSAASDNSASSDNSAAAAPAAADVPLYPGAVAAALPAEAGAPPAGAKSYSTSDSYATVKAWYQTNLKGAALKGSTPTGAMFLIGDTKTGTTVMLQSNGGKVWILTGPVASVH